MSLRRSFLSTKISHRSFTLSKSFKEFKSPDTQISFNYNRKEEIETAEKENDSNKEEQQNDVVGKSGLDNSGMWAGMLPELLGEIIQRVEVSEEQWPQRQNVVACGCVCKQWRKATKDVVDKASVHPQAAKITFPSCLKKVENVVYSEVLLFQISSLGISWILILVI